MRERIASDADLLPDERLHYVALERFAVEAAGPDGSMSASFFGIARRGFTRISWFEGRASVRLEDEGETRRAVAVSFELEWL